MTPLFDVLVVVAALAVAVTVASGTQPGNLLDVLDGNSAVVAFVFVATLVAGLWVRRRVPAGTAAWVLPVSAVFALADILGVSLGRSDAGLDLLLRSEPAVAAWVLFRVAGTFSAFAIGFALVLVLLGRYRERRPAAGRAASLLEAVRRGGWRSFAALLGVILVFRLPYLILWWPGIVPFDTFRSYSYARGVGEWEQYEPVGHSLLVAAMQAIGAALGWGDAGGVALGAILQVLTTSAAFAFLLARLAAWGLPAAVWIASLAWVALVPTLGLASVTIVKDVPFTSALVVFLTCLGEIARRRHDAAAPRWPWWTLLGASLALLVLRNNGLYVVVLGLGILAATVLRRHARRLLGILGVSIVAYALYAGPLTAALGAEPGPPAESWSVPIQQVARIAADHHDELTPAQWDFVDSVFDEYDATTIGAHYEPGISDPAKADANANWGERSTLEFVGGWLDLVAAHPLSAVEATLAGTVGYWAPGAPSYDGLIYMSHNDVRGVHLDIPSGPADGGLRAFLERNELFGDGLRAIPVLGLVLSPGVITWGWVIALVLVIRSRRWSALAVFVPAMVLFATLLAGPVSGGMRYSLGLYAALPLAVGVAVVSALSAPERERPLGTRIGRR
ncbi:hypothetical protein A7J15_06770 [Microbacterium sediminis]|uniref:Glycosyltransferase RgtA/B/C/D-like domain-containing protein n=2 Tax=Microbacterium sediminis TaxID=904291 RepID=A0A1B9NBB4_9MICO|nr:hypothetical protein A7J15_06770 [Microbacterium sediminis]